MRRKEEGYVPPGYRLPTAQLPASAVPGTKCQYLERGKSLTFQLLQNFPTNRRKITRELVIISCYFHGKFHRPPRVTTSSYTPPTPNLSLSLFPSPLRFLASSPPLFPLPRNPVYSGGSANFCPSFPIRSRGRDVLPSAINDLSAPPRNERTKNARRRSGGGGTIVDG